MHNGRSPSLTVFLYLHISSAVKPLNHRKKLPLLILAGLGFDNFFSFVSLAGSLLQWSVCSGFFEEDYTQFLKNQLNV
ncbi:hypothetical protein OC498_05220 [Acinetobacter bohemicus]|uniref:hypothetical protein n=1 Tax=Acinetobacter TaxID=469 RepID=UPI00209A9379|nr:MULTISPECIES: hypothetical protein [Acinetobacter]MCO8042181.1 hypothetical protein [Acinetobacter sp. S4400-12]MCU7224307.1 hypothetical protein [Acinetobacter bohemicus]